MDARGGLNRRGLQVPHLSCEHSAARADLFPHGSYSALHFYEYADLTTLKNAFSMHIPPTITRISGVDFLNTSLDLQTHEETSIIVADQYLSTYLEILFPEAEHILINFSMNFYDIHYQHIYEAIYKLIEQRYREYVKGLEKLM